MLGWNPAEAILGSHTDQDFSFTDAVSFVVMQARGIAEAFSVDEHFAELGFGRVAEEEVSHPGSASPSTFIPKRCYHWIWQFTAPDQRFIQVIYA